MIVLFVGCLEAAVLGWFVGVVCAMVYVVRGNARPLLSTCNTAMTSAHEQ